MYINVIPFQEKAFSNLIKRLIYDNMYSWISNIIDHFRGTKMVHKTPTGERVKQLRTEARKLSAALAAARQLADVEDLRDLQARLQERQEAAQAEASALKRSGWAGLGPFLSHLAPTTLIPMVSAASLWARGPRRSSAL